LVPDHIMARGQPLIINDGIQPGGQFMQGSG
jgi:hypothetical protein